MRSRIVRLLIALPGVLAPAAAAAQHERHQSATPQQPGVAQCLQVQPAVENILASAESRLESARQSNEPARMRAAIDEQQRVLRDLKAQLAPCAEAAAAASPHAGYATTGSPDPRAAHQPPPPAGASKQPEAPPAAVADPHASHGGVPATATSESPPAKPAEEHTGHGTPQVTASSPKSAKTPGKPIDPVTGVAVDPATAPKATYRGRTYYFSSDASRKEFLANPAKFAVKR